MFIANTYQQVEVLLVTHPLELHPQNNQKEPEHEQLQLSRARQ